MPNTSRRTATLGLALALTAAFAPAQATAAAQVGQPAPDFTALDTDGKPVALSSLRGKTVVLEWVNPGCPFVRKHYDASNMQAQQKEATAQGVVWLAVNSTARGTADFKAPADMAAWMRQQGAPARTLMDTDGKVGRAYGARTTPHMYVIDKAGKLVYAGAIDSKPSANPADIPGAVQHVRQALADLAAGKPVAVSSTRPYGCSVKYGDG
jgi:peroxiredoxin